MSERSGARELPTNFIAQAFRGLAYPLEGMRFISRHRLWGLALVSIIVNVLLLIGLVVATLYFLVPWLAGADVWLATNTAGTWFAFLGTVGSFFVWMIGITLAVAGNAIVLLLLGQAVASPFLDMLSEKVEAIVMQQEGYPFSIGRTIKSVVVAVTDLFWSVLFLLVVNIPIWVLGLSVVLAPFAAAASFCFTALLLSLEFVGLPLSRHLVSYRTRWRMMWSNRWLGLGFGTATMGMLLVPGLNLILLPLVAAGGTLMYCDLKAAGRLNLGNDTPKPPESAAA